MNPPENMSEVIGGRRYSVKTATLLAGDDFWDGSNFERGGRNEFLYRSKNGGYFTVTLTRWTGERDHLTPVSLQEAQELWERLSERRVSFEKAFPGVKVEDA